MGLGKALRDQNTVINTNVNTARTAVFDGGYNGNNIQNLADNAPPVTSNDMSAMINTTMTNAQQNQGNANNRANINGLTKPNVPPAADQTQYTIHQTIVENLWCIIVQNNLFSFYTNPRLQAIVDRLCRHDWRCVHRDLQMSSMNKTLDLCKGGLYDIILFLDDSGSMSSAEDEGRPQSEANMNRYETLKHVVSTLVFCATLVDEDGISIRFMNSREQGNGITSMGQVHQIFQQTRPSGTTPMGEQLKAKVIDGILGQYITSRQLQKPVLIVTVTDGVPDNHSAVSNAIKYAKNLCRQNGYSDNTLEFGFAQIGRNREATEWLNKLDQDPDFGDMVDATSHFDIEQAQCGPSFTASDWIIKLMLGSIDSAYDKADERGGQRSGGYQQQQGGYQQQQGGYQQQQGGYQQQQGSYQQQQGSYQQQQQSGLHQQKWN